MGKIALVVCSCLTLLDTYPTLSNLVSKSIGCCPWGGLQGVGLNPTTQLPHTMHSPLQCARTCDLGIGWTCATHSVTLPLQVCEKALADYMESKRRAFPRFYFVSTADLLDILSNGNNPLKVRNMLSSYVAM